MDPQQIESKSKYELGHVAFYGRTIREYELMFDLDLPALRGKTLLDCPTGASSFVSEAVKLGINVTGCDPMFEHDLATLRERGAADVDYVLSRIEKHQNEFQWSFYANPAEAREARTSALNGFLADYESGKSAGRYVNAALPKLPFLDQSFDVVLSGHFLFTYSRLLSYPFIRDSVVELIRVGRGDVRIMPLMSTNDRPYSRYEGIERLIGEVRGMGISAEIKKVKFEFQKGSNEMLQLRW